MSLISDYKLPKYIESVNMMPLCKYFVIKTGFTSRLLSSLKNLEDNIDGDEIPARIDFIYDGWCDEHKDQRLYTVNETNLDIINHVLSHTVRWDSQGIIVFSPKNIFEGIKGCEEEAKEVIDKISLNVCYNIANKVKDLNYCNIAYMADIEYIFHKDGNIIMFDYRADE